MQKGLKTGLGFKLNAQPASLFDKAGLMNSPNKASLADAIFELSGKLIPSLPSKDVFYGLDGGDLLNRIGWKKGETIENICKRYVDFVDGKFDKNVKIVFDGYPSNPTTKDTTHLKRTKGKQGKLIKFNLQTTLSMTKEKFLLNKENKHAFLLILSSYMNSNDIATTHADGDADLMIALTATEQSLISTVIVIGKDTDLLVLLIHHYQGNHSLYFTSCQDKKSQDQKIYDISHIKNSIPAIITKCILPIHAFLGCDTVSRIHSIGKGVESLKKVISCKNMQKCLLAFLPNDANHSRTR